MADLIIICRNKKQAHDLYHRTRQYLLSFDHPMIGSSKNDRLYIRDMVTDDSARFITLYEIRHKHIDDGLHGVRIEGDFYDKALDNCELVVNVQKTYINTMKNTIIDNYLGRY